MELIGINWGLLIIEFLIFGSWPILSLVALFALRRDNLTGTNQVLWALLIVVVPVLGALAYYIVRPKEGDSRQ